MLFVLLVSCSKASYVQSIPKSSMAVMAIDVPKLGKNLKAENILKTFIGVDHNFTDYGIDLSSKLYLFEAADMNCSPSTPRMKIASRLCWPR